MTALDWFLVLAINGAIVGFGLWHARGTRRSVDWFLAAKKLPWWLVGLSMFATAVDSGDYVAVAGNAYQDGLIYISAWWLGLSVGWCTVAYLVFIPMYRCGMFTNAEYLEYRFGPVARIMSVFIQIQTRTNVMGVVAYSLFLTFSILTGWGTATWWLVVGIAVAAAAYTATGGIRSVAITDAMQSVVMLIAAVALWWIVFDDIGGWTGLQQKLSDHVEAGKVTQSTAQAMTHIGAYAKDGVPPGIVVFGFVVVLTGYCIVNQSQAMRLLAARSIWDMKMAAVVAGTITACVLWFNITLGIFGRAIVPDLEQSDTIFPTLLAYYLPSLQTGLLGIVLAGLLAGGLSTYDSIGSALAAVFTRDLYARFLVTDADDRHYLKAGRIATVVVIALSFAYVPFLEDGMVAFYLKITGVAVVPLMIVYLMGVLTPVARNSATVGLIVGIVCGLSRFVDPVLGQLGWAEFPTWWTNTWWGYIWSMLATIVAMLVTSTICGWATHDEIAGLTLATSKKGQSPSLSVVQAPNQKSSWLAASRRDVPTAMESPFDTTGGVTGWVRNPLLWAALLLGITSYLNIVVFW